MSYRPVGPRHRPTTTPTRLSPATRAALARTNGNRGRGRRGAGTVVASTVLLATIGVLLVSGLLVGGTTVATVRSLESDLPDPSAFETLHLP